MKRRIVAGLPPGAHRVVGVGEIDQRRVLALHRRKQSVEAFAVVFVWHGDQPPAETCDVEVEGRVGPERGDDSHARRDHHAHDEVEQPVYAFADDDIVVGDAEMGSDRGLEVEIVGVAIHPHVWRRRPHGRDDRGRRPKLLSLAPMRARKGRPPRSRSCASGPTKGTVGGSAATSGVRAGRWTIENSCGWQVAPDFLLRNDLECNGGTRHGRPLIVAGRGSVAYNAPADGCSHCFRRDR